MKRQEGVNFHGLDLKYAKPHGVPDSDSEFTETDQDSEDEPDVSRCHSNAPSPYPVHLGFTHSKLSESSSGIDRRSIQQGAQSDHSAQCLRPGVDISTSPPFPSGPGLQPAEEHSMGGSQPPIELSSSPSDQRDTVSEPPMNLVGERESLQHEVEADSHLSPAVAEPSIPSTTVRDSKSPINGSTEPGAATPPNQSSLGDAVVAPSTMDVQHHTLDQLSLVPPEHHAATRVSMQHANPMMTAETAAVARHSGRQSIAPRPVPIEAQKEDQAVSGRLAPLTTVSSRISLGSGRAEKEFNVIELAPTSTDVQSLTTRPPALLQSEPPAPSRNPIPSVPVPMAAETVAVVRQSNNRKAAPAPQLIARTGENCQTLKPLEPSTAAHVDIPPFIARGEQQAYDVSKQLSQKNAAPPPTITNNDWKTSQNSFHHLREVYEESANTAKTGDLSKQFDALDLGYSNVESTQECDTLRNTRIQHSEVSLGDPFFNHLLNDDRNGDRKDNLNEVQKPVRFSNVVETVRNGNGEVSVGKNSREDSRMLFEYASTASPHSRRGSHHSLFSVPGSRRCSVNVGLQPNQSKDEIVANSVELRNARRRSSIGLQGRRQSVADVSPQLGFEGAVRAPNGVLMCEVDGKKFELIVEEEQDVEEGMKGVQCTAADIDADMDILFAPLLVEPELEVVKKKIDVAVQWTGSECSTPQPNVKDIGNARGTGTQSNAVLIDEGSSAGGIECRICGDSQARPISATNAAEVTNPPSKEEELEDVHLSPPGKGTTENEVLLESRDRETNTAEDEADKDTSVVGMDDTAPMRTEDTGNEQVGGLLGMAQSEASDGACNKLRRVSKRSISKRSSMKSASVKTVSRSEKTREVKPPEISETSGASSSQAHSATRPSEEHIAACTDIDGIVVEELPQSDPAENLDEEVVKQVDNGSEALAGTQLGNHPSASMEIVRLASDVVVSGCGDQRQSTNTLMENEVNTGHETQIKGVLENGTCCIQEVASGGASDIGPEFYVGEERKQGNEKEGYTKNTSGVCVNNEVLQANSDAPQEEIELGEEDFENEDFEPYIQDDDACNVVPSIDNSAASDEVLRTNDIEDVQNSEREMDASRPVRKTSSKLPLDVARVIDLDLYCSPPKRSTILMPDGIDIKPQATPAKEPRKHVRKATKRKRETQDRPSRKITPNTRKNEKSRREMHRLGLTSMAVPSEVTTLSEVPLDDAQPRRSKRRKFPPLQYWRNEKKVYERRRSQLLPTISRVVVAVEQDSEDESQLSFEALKARKVVVSRR